MSETVLVTGGFGLVGSATVKRLAADGRRVVAADLGTPAQRKAAKLYLEGAELVKRLQPEEAWKLLQQAAELDPGNSTYARAAEMAGRLGVASSY